MPGLKISETSDYGKARTIHIRNILHIGEAFISESLAKNFT